MWMIRNYDAIVIGGGFFGLNIADYVQRNCNQERVLVIDKESDFMKRASYNNQARVHGGYHYPRSLLTGLRSQVNFDQFVNDYKQAIVSDFDKYYAIAKQFTKVTSRQFSLFCDRIGADTEQAPAQVRRLFNPQMIEDVFKVKEYAFDAGKLKEMLLKKLDRQGADLKPGTSATSILQTKDGLCVETSTGQKYYAKNVYNCTYASINMINKNSGLPTIPLKHELAEMCLVKLPATLENVYVTVMCGPFFSYMPFPDRRLVTLSHVRYTPHTEWHDHEHEYRDGHDFLAKSKRQTHFSHMQKDAARYIPDLQHALHKDSLWEVKTVLPQSEQDDSRPILFRQNHGLNGYHCILGAKLDNIYDAFRDLDSIYGTN